MTFPLLPHTPEKVLFKSAPSQEVMSTFEVSTCRDAERARGPGSCLLTQPVHEGSGKWRVFVLISEGLLQNLGFSWRFTVVESWF